MQPNINYKVLKSSKYYLDENTSSFLYSSFFLVL